MKIIFGLSVFLLALLAWQVSWAGPMGNAGEKMHEGTVVSAGAGRLSMMDADGKEHAYKVPNDAQITVNGRPGKLADLKAGMRVRVLINDHDEIKSIATVDTVKSPSRMGQEHPWNEFAVAGR